MTDVSSFLPNRRRVHELARQQNVQEYSSKPPGVGMAVVYVGVCIQSDKLYVGKFAHYKKNKSVSQTRWRLHNQGKGGAKLVERAVVKYGSDAFEWFVIDHVKKDDVNEREVFWIERLGSLRNRQSPTDGGYNLHPGGTGGVFTEEHAQNIKKALNSQIVKQKILSTNQTAATKERRSKAQHTKFSNPDFAKRHRSILQNPSRRSKMSTSSEANWKDSVYRSKVANGRAEIPNDKKDQQIAELRKRRMDINLEEERIQKFSKTFSDKRAVEYRAALESNILEWPKKGQPKLPKPQYYRRNGSVGYCHGPLNRFVSIDPEDHKERLQRRTEQQKQRRHGKA